MSFTLDIHVDYLVYICMYGCVWVAVTYTIRPDSHGCRVALSNIVATGHFWLVRYIIVASGMLTSNIHVFTSLNTCAIIMTNQMSSISYEANSSWMIIYI